MPEKSVKRRLRRIVTRRSPPMTARSSRLSPNWSTRSSVPFRRERKRRSEKRKHWTSRVNYSAGPSTKRLEDGIGWSSSGSSFSFLVHGRKIGARNFWRICQWASRKGKHGSELGTRLDTAVHRLQAMVGSAGALVDRLKNHWQSIQPNSTRSYICAPNRQVFEGWPESKDVNDALIECHEAQLAFAEARASLDAEDLALLKPP